MKTRIPFSLFATSALVLTALTGNAAAANFQLRQYTEGVRGGSLMAWATVPNGMQTFAAANVGQAATDISLAIQNKGNLPGSLATPTLTGANAADFSVSGNTCSNVSAGGSCVMTFHFVPSAAGARSASTSLLGTALTFSGTGLGASFAGAGATAQSFNSAAVGVAATPNISLTVTNTGNSAGVPWTTTPAITGANAADFSIVSDTCKNQSIAANNTCSVSLGFIPSQTGTRTAGISLAGTAYTLSGTGTVATDGNYANVVMLLPLDSSTSDAKGTAITNQNVSISSATSVFGGASAYFSGSSSYLTFPYSANFNFSNMTSFTVEMWFNLTSTASAQYLMEKGTWGSNHDFSIYIPNSTTIKVMTSGTTSQLTATVPTLTTGSWYHIAVVRNNGTNTLYLNGVPYGSNTMGFSNSDGNPIIIGAASWNNPTVQPLRGYLDELRITRNVARYTGSFTPPTVPFPLQ